MAKHVLSAMVLALIGCGSADTTEDRFVSTYGEAFCSQSAACNPALECSPSIDDKGGCAYDADAAAACLSGSWSCNTEFDGFEFAEPPTECSAVWDCTVARR